MIRIRDRLRLRILNLLKEGLASKTKIMYEVGLSRGQMRIYVPDLIEKYVEYNHMLRAYEIRDNGRNY